MGRNNIGVAVYLIVLFGGVTFLLYLKNWDLNFIIDVLFIGIVTSLIGSIAFISLLWLLKPNIKISKKIAQPNTAEDEPKYLFKFVNNSSIFSLYNIRVKLYKVRRETVEGGINSYFDPLDIKKDKITRMPNKKSDQKEAFFAQILTTQVQLDTILKNKDSLIELQIQANHALSGFSKVFSKKYHTISCIEKGGFAHGDNFTIAQ